MATRGDDAEDNKSCQVSYVKMEQGGFMVDAAEADRAERKAALRPMTSVRFCGNCPAIYEPGDCSKDNKRMMSCSACKDVFYCSKDCQRAHWKAHKPHCKAHFQSAQKAMEQGYKRGFHLFQKWKHRFCKALLGKMLMVHFGATTLSKMQEKKMFVRWDLAFDYNKRTFLPKEKPELVPIKTQDSHQAEMIRDSYKRSPESDAVVVAALVCESFGVAFVPVGFNLPIEAVPEVEWDYLIKIMNEMELTRQKSAWQRLRSENIEKQLHTVRQHTYFFSSFLFHALGVQCRNAKDRRYKTHIVRIDMEIGHGLGEIRSLLGFSVEPVEEIRSKEEAFLLKSEMSEQDRDEHLANTFDLEQSPALLQSQRQNPKNVLLPVRFVGNGCSFTMPVITELPTYGGGSMTRDKSDKKAKQAFEQLKLIRLPPVTSPPLD